MQIFAYCTRRARVAVARALRVIPLTAPPLLASTFEPRVLENAALLYFRLHEIQPSPTTWFGETLAGELVPALHISHLRGLDLDGAVVVIGNCYGKHSLFVQAFYDAGARAVIAGAGHNYAGAQHVLGTDLLVRWIRAGLQSGIPIAIALQIAKWRLHLTRERRGKTKRGIVKPNADALEFDIIKRKLKEPEK